MNGMGKLLSRTLRIYAKDVRENAVIDIGAMIAEKHEFNKTRSYKHGGKVI